MISVVDRDDRKRRVRAGRTDSDSSAEVRIPRSRRAAADGETRRLRAAADGRLGEEHIACGENVAGVRLRDGGRRVDEVVRARR